MTKKPITDLQAGIESIHNTRDFERLVNDVFSRIYGADYIPTKYHGDKGMDGYISTSKTLVAKHCFENPVPVKDNINSEILKKARSDLKQAIILSKDLDIDNWMFITPYLVPTDVIVKLKHEVEKVGFKFQCPGPVYIAGVVRKNKDILENHQNLHVLYISEDIRELKKYMKPVTTDQISQSRKVVRTSSKPALKKAITTKKPEQSSRIYKSALENEKSKDYKRVLQIYKKTPNSKLEKEVKSIIYSSSDQGAVLQGVHLLVSWYKTSRDTIDDHLLLINIGIETARALKSLSSEAVLLAEKGSLLSVKFVLLDLEGWGRIEMSNTVGLPIITKNEKDGIVQELKSLNRDFNGLFKDAINKAYASKEYLAITKTLSRIGDAAGNRAGHFMSLGIKDRALVEQDLCKGSFVHAKSVAAQFGDEVETVYVLYNFANALGFMCETGEALLVLKKVAKLGKKLNMKDILVNIDELEQTIKEPKIKLVNND